MVDNLPREILEVFHTRCKDTHTRRRLPHPFQPIKEHDYQDTDIQRNLTKQPRNLLSISFKRHNLKTTGQDFSLNSS